MRISDPPCRKRGLFPGLDRPILLIAAVLLVTVSATALLTAQAWRASRTIYLTLLKLEANNVESRGLYFSNPIVANLEILRQWGRLEDYDLSGGRGLDEGFIPFLRQYRTNPHISSLVLAEESGRAYCIERDDKWWVTTRFTPGARDVTWKRLDENLRTVASGRDVKPFEPARAPWFKRGLEDDAVDWTDAYELPLEHRRGFTASAAWKGKKGTRFIAAFNIPLEDARKAFAGERADGNRVVFLVSDDRNLIDLSKPGGELVASLSTAPGAAQEGEDFSALRACWESSRRAYEPLRFKWRGEAWWAEFRPLFRGPEGLRSSWIGVALPETYLLADVKRQGLGLLALSIVVLLAGAGMAVILLKKYRAKAAELAQVVRRGCYPEEELRALVAGGENATVEFKSTLRWDVSLGKVNTKLEEVILKSVAAFANAEGGTLVIGVSDEGGVLGLESDYATLKEPDRDHFELHLRNLVNAAYGMEFATESLAVAFPRIDGKEICVVDVSAGERPLYTLMTDRNGQKAEKFFVRSGNSSREFSRLSEIAEYVGKRFVKG